MKILIAVYDSKAEMYSPTPQAVMTKGEAIRAFQDECKNPDSKLNKFAEDFSLWQIGEYDERKGIVLGFQQKIHLSNAWENREARNVTEEKNKWPAEPTASKTPQASASTGQLSKQSTHTRQHSAPRI